MDAATGKEIWNYKPFDSVPGGKGMYFGLNSNRGVAYWTDGADDERLFYTAGPFLRAVNAKTGKAIESFGVNGKVDLREGLGVDASRSFCYCHIRTNSLQGSCTDRYEGVRSHGRSTWTYPRI